MERGNRERITRMLTRDRNASVEIGAELMPLLYRELRAIAASLLKRERVGHTLEPTALVHEAFVRLVDLTGVTSADRSLFLSLAAKAMRRVLVEHARKRAAAKRGGVARRITLSSGSLIAPGPELDVLALDEALAELAAREPRAATVVEMRFFGGMVIDEIAEALGISKRSVEADWTFARTWLHRKLE